MNPKIDKLVKLFAKLPRLGGRAAQRIVLGLLQDKTGRARVLAAALLDAAETIAPCPVCGCLTDSRSAGAESSACAFCRDSSRANGQICIVRDLGDVWTIERSGVFGGRYHILGGLISGTSGTTPEDLNIAALPARMSAEIVREVIFALPNTIEGKTTMHYIISMLKSRGADNAAFSELASGVPLGGDLDYIDDGTLSLAFGRREKI
jgi:recombination protein RecR